jgi:hypothetical protein
MIFSKQVFEPRSPIIFSSREREGSRGDGRGWEGTGGERGLRTWLKW